MPKPIFWEEFNVGFYLLKSNRFSEKDVSSRIDIVTDGLQIKTQLSIWYNCLSERRHSICYEMFLRRIKLRKTAFWNCHFISSVLRKRWLSEKLWFRKFIEKDGGYIAGRQKVKDIAFFSKFLPRIGEYDTQPMEDI